MSDQVLKTITMKTSSYGFLYLFLSELTVFSTVLEHYSIGIFSIYGFAGFTLFALSMLLISKTPFLKLPKTTIVTIPIVFFVAVIFFDGINAAISGYVTSWLLVAIKIICIFLLASVYISSGGGVCSLLKPTNEFCLLMALLGSFAWLIALLDLTMWELDVSYLKKNAEGGANGLYSAPFALGLLLTGEGTYLPFPRASGWSIEPAVASFAVIPSFFYYLYRGKPWQVAIIAGFLLICFSLTAIFALALLALSKFSLRFIVFLLVSFFLVALFSSSLIFQSVSQYLEYKVVSGSSVAFTKNLYAQNLLDSELIGNPLFVHRDSIHSPGDGQSILVKLGLYVAYLSVAVTTWFKIKKSGDERWVSFSLIALMIISLKSPPSFLYYGMIYIYFFGVLYAKENSRHTSC